MSRDMTKPTVTVRPAKTQISLGIRPVWSESSLSAWRKLGSLATHWAHSEDSGQTGRMPRLIWVFAGRTLILLVLSCRGSYIVEFEVIRMSRSSMISCSQFHIVRFHLSTSLPNNSIAARRFICTNHRRCKCWRPTNWHETEEKQMYTTVLGSL